MLRRIPETLQYEVRGIYYPQLKAVRNDMFGFIEIPKSAQISLIKKTMFAVIWVREVLRRGRARFEFYSATKPDRIVSYNFFFFV